MGDYSAILAACAIVTAAAAVLGVIVHLAQFHREAERDRRLDQKDRS